MSDCCYVVTVTSITGDREIGRYGFTRALIEVARLRKLYPGMPWCVSVHNDDRHDCDYIGDREVYHDGLTSEERDMVNEVGQPKIKEVIR